jgi:hypothetical protein
MNDGWISLHRKFLEWEWFSDNNMVKLFIYLLLKANHSTNTWKGIEIKRGQLLTGLDQLNFQTKISIQTLRTCLKRLEKTQEINMQVTNKYRIITVCNYDSYQDSQQATNKQTNKQLTSNQQTTNKQLTANNNVNKENNENNDNKEKVYVFNFRKELLKLGIEENIADAWIKVRKTKKATNSDIALNAVKKQITLSGKTANECIIIAVENSWSGFKAEWIEDKNNGKFKKPDFEKIKEYGRKLNKT